MSRLAKKPIIIPAKTDIAISGNQLSIKGPLGELSRVFPEAVSIVREGDALVVTLPKVTKETKALLGTTASHIKNMIAGVNTLYEKKLLIEGVGFKADAKPEKIVLALGFSHPVEVVIPKSLKVATEKGEIRVSGINKEEVSAFAAKLRALKVPEPYKGKGIRYHDEVIRRKQGKKTA